MKGNDVQNNILKVDDDDDDDDDGKMDYETLRNAGIFAPFWWD